MVAHVYAGNMLYRGQGSWTSSGFTFRANPFQHLSWSSGVSKALKAERCGCYARGVSTINQSSKLCTYIRVSSTKYYDFTVIGSGVAGLRYALEVANHGIVAVITKDEPHESNTNYAQGGVSAVLCPLDYVESHMQDTMVAGAYL